MFQLRRANERGGGKYDWLDTRHSFSFADYHDPRHMGFRALRVINEDWVAPGAGFGMHGHRDMEIVTYVLEGELQHRDSMGNGSVLPAGAVQHMTAGTGIRHSEFNPSPSAPVHLYQVWLLPERPGLVPSYSEARFDPAEKKDRWRLVAAPDGRDGALPTRQDATLALADLSAGTELAHRLAPGRHAWLQVVRGDVTVGDLALSAGDGLAVSDEPGFSVRADGPGEVLLFDLA
jgi:redox-sensitive bicupin YhaK (pirin superfamily)